MSCKPFLLRVAQLSAGTDVFGSRDVFAADDSPSATVEKTPDGYVLARETRLTETKTETTDDK
jgi:hypothetical protein